MTTKVTDKGIIYPDGTEQTTAAFGSGGGIDAYTKAETDDKFYDKEEINNLLEASSGAIVGNYKANYPNSVARDPEAGNLYLVNAMSFTNNYDEVTTLYISKTDADGTLRDLNKVSEGNVINLESANGSGSYTVQSSSDVETHYEFVVERGSCEGTLAQDDDVTALVEVVSSKGGLPVGTIVIWSKPEVPEGWQICDGTNNTPDLRNRFVVGAGSTYGLDATGGSADAVVVSHNHGATSSVSDSGHFHSTGNPDTGGGSFFGIIGASGGNAANRDSLIAGLVNSNTYKTNTKTTGISVSTSVASNGVSGTNKNLPPYYALYYIMKMEEDAASIGGGIEEAPEDGKQYARQNEAWTEVKDSYTKDEVDAFQEAQDTVINSKLDEAPEDGKQYARKDAEWTEVTGGGEVATLPSNRNLVMNGGMRIAQWKSPEFNLSLNKYHVSVTASSSNFHTVDRWLYIMAGAGTYEISQEYDGEVEPRVPQDVPLNVGVSHTAKMVCTTASATPILLGMVQNWEGQFLQHLKWGTPEAENLTLSFWIKSNKTGVYTANLRRYDANVVEAPKTLPRLVGLEYTINAVDTWEKKTITFPADTDPIGAFNTNLKNKCLSLELWFAAGDMYTNGTFTNGTWTNIQNGAGNEISPNQVNLSETVGNYINITAVQLEKGDKATDFEVLPITQELLNCQRYCQSFTKFNGVSTGNNELLCSFDFKTTMSKNSGMKLIQDGLFSFTDGTDTYTQSSEGAYIESSGGISSEGVTLKLRNFTFPAAGKMFIKKEIDNTQTKPSRLIIDSEL